MNRIFRLNSLNNSFDNINGRVHRLWVDAPENAINHTKPSNITNPSNSVRGFRLSSIAVALLAALSAPAIAEEDITYDDSHPTGLKPEFIDTRADVAGAKSFYPVELNSLSNNSVTVNTVSGDTLIPWRVYGGVTSGAGATTGNNVQINADAQVTDMVIGGYSESGSATGHIVTMTGGSVTGTLLDGSMTGYVRGGVSRASGETSNNAVILSGGVVGRSVYGGINNVGDGLVTRNRVTISGGTIGDHVYGGYALKGSATDNVVDISSGTVTSNIYGGWVQDSSFGGTATNNAVTISGDALIKLDVYGAYVEDVNDGRGSASNNTVTMSSGVVNKFVYGGFSQLGNATNNIVTISGGEVLGDVYGGQANPSHAVGLDGGSAIGNTVNISGGQVGSVYGAFAMTGSASGNTVNISSGNVTGDASLSLSPGFVFGGLSQTGPATGNTVNISNGTVTGDVLGGNSRGAGEASNNAVNISGGTVLHNIYGGYADISSATGNTVNISGAPTLTNSILFGGFKVSGTSDVVTGNTLIYSGNYAGSPVVVKDIQNFQNYQFNLSGVQAGNTIFSNDAGAGPDMTGSTVSITAPSFTTALGSKVTLISKTQGTYAGPTELGPLTGTNGADYSYLLSQIAGNPLSLFLSKLTTTGDLSLTGPYAANAGTVAGESVTLDVGGTLTVDGALSMTSNATNAATLKAGTLVTPSLTLTGANTSATIGTLQVSQNTAVNLDATSTGNVAINGLAFSNSSALTVTPTNGGSMTFGGNLNVTGSGNTLNTPIAYNAAGKALTFSMAGVTAGDTMLSVNGSQPNLTGATLNITDVTNPSFQEGDRVTFLHSDGGITGDAILPSSLSRSVGLISYELGITQTQNDLYAQFLSLGASEASKALLEGQVANLAFVNQGADLVAGAGLRAANNAAQQAEGAIGYSPFVAMSGGSLRYATGSSVEVSGVNMVMGLAARSTRQNIDYLGGAFFEFGQGNYSTFNSFVNSPEVHGDGDTDYMGGGFLGRAETPYSSGRLYGEASLRAGSVDNKFNTNDIMPNAERSSYDISSPYIGAHGGVGYEFAIASGFTMDVSDRLIWTQQDGENATVNDQLVKFDAANSLRNRVGARLSAEITEKFKPYVGTYWEHEFDGEQNGSVNDHAIDAPTLEGDTGIAELGFTLLSSKDHLNIDAGVQGYTGKREDLTGSLRARWDF